MIKVLTGCLCFLVIVINSYTSAGQENEKVPYAGVLETSPSRSVYYDFANQNGHGTDEHKILADLEFFKWMYDNYGMQLDLFVMDGGLFDKPGLSPNPGKIYGNLESSRFSKQFPYRFKNIYEMASSFKCRLGLTIGPDGFGASNRDAAKRIDFLANLCKDYHFGLFSLNGKISKLRTDKEVYLLQAIQKARTYSPDLIVSERGLSLGSPLSRYIAVGEWANQGAYTDVDDFNSVTGLHHRLGSMDRAEVPGLSRLVDDKGVGLSSALDYWQDDLILQAFNRNTLFAPEIFGNPWLLKDEELSVLARIFTLHQEYNSILAVGKTLPAAQYGENAVSRGDNETRLITLRNLSWVTKKYKIQLDSTIGIKADGTYMVKQLFPTEKYIGRYTVGNAVEVSVEPFHAALFVATVHSTLVDIRGCDYEVIRAVPGKPVLIKLMGNHGQRVKLTWGGSQLPLTTAQLGRANKPEFFRKGMSFRFPGSKTRDPFHYRLGAMKSFEITAPQAEFVYEGACFSADNNALEVRSLQRAGISQIREVNLARNAFFLDSTFINKGLWDKYAFDGEDSTYFKAERTLSAKGDEPVGSFRLDLGKAQPVDQFLIESVNVDYKPGFAEYSSDLKHWSRVMVVKQASHLSINFPFGTQLRCLRIKTAPTRTSEIRGFFNGHQLPRAGWKASNLFAPFEDRQPTQAFRYAFKIRKAANNSYLALSVPGNYAKESVYASLMIDGHIMGATDRSPSFPYNNWAEYGNGTGNYTFYFPLTRNMFRKKLELVLVSSNKEQLKIVPEVWVSAYPAPQEEKLLTLQ